MAEPVKYFDIEIDEDNEAHLTRHGVTIAEVIQVLRNDQAVRRNRRHRAAGYIATGTTDGGRRVKIALDHEDGRVRPITAWEL